MDEEKTLPDGIEEDAADKRGIAGPFFLTLLVLASVGGLAYMPSYFEQAFKADGGWLAAEAGKQTGWWVDNVGDYHPLILHLPIGIIFLAVVMEVFGWLSFGRYKPRTTLALFLAFVGGSLACVSGMFWLKTGGYAADEWADDMFKHMWMGIAFVGVLALAFVTKLWARPGGGAGPVYAILLFGTAGIMGYGAHFGGLQTHGSDPVKTTLEGLGLVGQKADEKKAETEPEPVPAKLPKDRLAFAEVVMPILDTRCLACHSEEAGKKKGKLLMDSYANLLIGGRSVDDGFPTLVPGHADKSYMIEVVNLPLDDDMRMPPEDEEQIEEHEVKILTWWVNSIPESDTLEDKTLAEMGAPQEILDAAAKLVTPEEKARMEAEAKAAAEKAEKERLAKREALQNALDTLRQQDAFKTSLKYVSRDSSDLEFTSVSLGPSLDDETLAKLGPVSSALVSLDVSRSSVTESALATELPKMTSLRRLNLSQTEVGDGILAVVASLDNLEYLNLYGTKVTDEGILSLKTLGGLEDLYLWESQVSEAGAKALKEELPGLYVNLGAVELK